MRQAHSSQVSQRIASTVMSCFALFCLLLGSTACQASNAQSSHAVIELTETKQIWEFIETSVKAKKQTSQVWLCSRIAAQAHAADYDAKTGLYHWTATEMSANVGTNHGLDGESLWVTVTKQSGKYHITIPEKSFLQSIWEDIFFHNDNFVQACELSVIKRSPSSAALRNISRHIHAASKAGSRAGDEPLFLTIGTNSVSLVELINTSQQRIEDPY